MLSSSSCNFLRASLSSSSCLASALINIVVVVLVTFDFLLLTLHSKVFYYWQFELTINLRWVLRAAIILVLSFGVLHVVEGVNFVVELILLWSVLIFFSYSFGVLNGCGAILTCLTTFCLWLSWVLDLFTLGALCVLDWTSRRNQGSWSKTLSDASSAAWITEYWGFRIVISKCILYSVRSQWSLSLWSHLKRSGGIRFNIFIETLYLGERYWLSWLFEHLWILSELLRVAIDRMIQKLVWITSILLHCL